MPENREDFRVFYFFIAEEIKKTKCNKKYKKEQEKYKKRVEK